MNKEGHCPKCGKEGEYRGRVQFKEELKEAFFCFTCNKFWNDVYEITFAGQRFLNVPNRKKVQK